MNKTSFQRIEKSFLATAFAMMLPFPIALIVFGITLIVCLTNYNVTYLFHSKTHKYALSLFVLAMISSLVYKNTKGLLVIGIGVLFYIFALYYSEFITKKTFDKQLNILLVMSIPNAFAGLAQIYDLFPQLDYRYIHPMLWQWGDARATASFYHPNYYALICVFLLLIVSYKLYVVQNFKTRLWYVGIAAVNVMGVIVTMTRSIMFALLPALLVMCWCMRYRRTSKYILVGSLVVIVVALLVYQHIPRFDPNVIEDNVDIRYSIWQAALKATPDSWLIGRGPLAYMNIYEQYGGYPTQHAHNIVLDSVLSYGVIGLVLIGVLSYRLIKRLNNIRYIRQMRPLYALCMASVIAVVVHGMIDISILWVQTMYLFIVIVFSTQGLYKDYQQGKFSDIYLESE